MGLSYILKIISLVYNIGRTFGLKAISKFFMMWKDGYWRLFGIIVFVGAVHYDEVVTFLVTFNPGPLFASLSVVIGSSWEGIKAGLAALPSQSGLGYLDSFGQVLFNATNIVWYYATVFFFANRGNRTNSPLVIGGLATIIFLILAWHHTGQVPLFSDLGLLGNVESMFDVSRLNPLADPAANVSSNTTVDAASNQTIS